MSPGQRQGHGGDLCGFATAAQGPWAHPWMPASFPGSLLRTAPTSCGAGDVWPARSLLPLMSPPVTKIAN